MLSLRSTSRYFYIALVFGISIACDEQTTDKPVQRQSTQSGEKYRTSSVKHSAEYVSQYGAEIPDWPVSKMIKVIGKAGNAKLGASVRVDYDADNYKVYYIDGLDQWPEAYLGQMVQLTGTLHVIKRRPQPAFDGTIRTISPGPSGEICRIKDASWNLIP